MSRARELSELATAYDSGGGFGMRNRIINGDMRIDQRNAGASVAFASGVNTYALDRWYVDNATDGAFTIEQVEDAPAGFYQSTKLTVTTTDASIGATQDAVIQQRIEGLNVTDLGFGTASASTVTLSFWVKSSLTGSFGGSLMNSAYNRAYAFSFTISAANTWEQKTVTIAGDTSGTWLYTNGIGMRVTFSMAAGSSYSGTANTWASSLLFQPTGSTNIIGTNGATFYITGVQLEAGSVASPFERRDYGRELMMCQRYFSTSVPQGTAPAPNLSFAVYQTSAAINTTNALGVGVRFPVEMRTTPTMTFYPSAAATGSAGTASYYTGSWSNKAVTVHSSTSSTGFAMDTGGGGFTTNAATLVQFNYAASSEL